MITTDVWVYVCLSLHKQPGQYFIFLSCCCDLILLLFGSISVCFLFPIKLRFVIFNFKALLYSTSISILICFCISYDAQIFVLSAISKSFSHSSFHTLVQTTCCMSSCLLSFVPQVSKLLPHICCYVAILFLLLCLSNVCSYPHTDDYSEYCLCLSNVVEIVSKFYEDNEHPWNNMPNNHCALLLLLPYLPKSNMILNLRLFPPIVRFYTWEIHGLVIIFHV